MLSYYQWKNICKYIEGIKRYKVVSKKSKKVIEEEIKLRILNKINQLIKHLDKLYKERVNLKDLYIFESDNEYNNIIINRYIRKQILSELYKLKNKNKKEKNFIKYVLEELSDTLIIDSIKIFIKDGVYKASKDYLLKILKLSNENKNINRYNCSMLIHPSLIQSILYCGKIIINDDNDLNGVLNGYVLYIWNWNKINKKIKEWLKL